MELYDIIYNRREVDKKQVTPEFEKDAAERFKEVFNANDFRQDFEMKIKHKNYTIKGKAEMNYLGNIYGIISDYSVFADLIKDGKSYSLKMAVLGKPHKEFSMSLGFHEYYERSADFFVVKKASNLAFVEGRYENKSFKCENEKLVRSLEREKITAAIKNNINAKLNISTLNNALDESIEVMLKAI